MQFIAMASRKIMVELKEIMSSFGEAAIFNDFDGEIVLLNSRLYQPMTDDVLKL